MNLNKKNDESKEMDAFDELIEKIKNEEKGEEDLYHTLSGAEAEIALIVCSGKYHEWEMMGALLLNAHALTKTILAHSDALKDSGKEHLFLVENKLWEIREDQRRRHEEEKDSSQ